MLSKWYELKEKAIYLRKRGTSIGVIERKFGIPRSTLSGWFRNLKLTKEQKERIMERATVKMSRARIKAVLWHNKQKEIRIKIAQSEAINTLKQINKSNMHILELALSMLYLGEGDKTNVTSMGNSNPLILKFFISSVKKLFSIELSDIRCDLHLRSDQDEKESVLYWSRELKIPYKYFSTTKDKRIVKSKTYPNYKGVCVVRCGKVAIQRRLVHLGEEFCKIVAEDP